MDGSGAYDAWGNSRKNVTGKRIIIHVQRLNHPYRKEISPYENTRKIPLTGITITDFGKAISIVWLDCITSGWIFSFYSRRTSRASHVLWFRPNVVVHW